jgi:hypothetical protein
MRPRELLLLFALSSFLVAGLGLLLRAANVDPMAGGPTFIAGLMTVGFLTAAWYVGGRMVERACRACGVGPVLAVGFCATCGADSDHASR